MTFQKGDQQLVIRGTSYGLRLTMGALAEINSRLSVAGPKELSTRLRSLNAADGRVLLACVMRPCLSLQGKFTGPAATLSEAEMSDVLPHMCKLFEEAFSYE